MKGSRTLNDRRMPDRPAKEFRIVNPDEAVLNLLRRGRADLSKERLITFYLYFPNRQTAEAVGNELAELGFSIECIEESGKESWLCLVTKNLVPRIEDLTSIHELMDRIAASLGGNYDGWETALSPDEAEGMPGVE